MSIITLTTDFGLKDYYVGALKGKLLSKKSDITIIDITHSIDLYNIFEAFYVVKATYKNFPPKTIHIIGVDAELNDFQDLLVAYWNNQYFLCADNGILTLLFGNNIPEQIVAIKKVDNSLSETDLFVAISCKIIEGESIENLGKKNIQLKPILQIQWHNNNLETEIVGKIIYIDAYGNCITDIHIDLFEKARKNRNFEIYCKNKKINHLNANYSGFKNLNLENIKSNEGRLLAHFNDENFLEFAIYKGTKNNGGTAQTLIGLKFLDKITIKFV